MNAFSLFTDTRVVDGVTYVMEHTRYRGVIWHGGIVGGDITSPKGTHGAFNKAAARQAQAWAWKNYQQALDYVRAYESELDGRSPPQAAVKMAERDFEPF